MTFTEPMIVTHPSTYATNLLILYPSKQQYARVDMHMPIIISVLYCHIVLVNNVSPTGMGKLWQKQITMSRRN